VLAAAKKGCENPTSTSSTQKIVLVSKVGQSEYELLWRIR
jgi:hypothetical protein